MLMEYITYHNICYCKYWTKLKKKRKKGKKTVSRNSIIKYLLDFNNNELFSSVIMGDL